MLELKNIIKDYPAGDNTVHALKGIDLQFRSNEFVSILGPSGCGKTTMLNIIGGLDHYTSGDLIINGTSTTDFKDKNWDTYRNHSIGFVFQSYNLIPHQTVLQNVELALTLSGVSKSERKERAKKALEQVGLGNQLKKKPSEMSGGQMQRVAIARALVNNPDIILADEPTGALDTETSIQVMEILKEISKDKLIIMVTHNPELAKKYSTRIIRMLDGEIKSDSKPLDAKEVQMEQAKEKARLIEEKSKKNPSMSFGTSFLLSLKNLVSKKSRTTLTAFAGSIGIIGIALIFAVSQGMTSYINTVQENTLSSYPLTIEATSIDLSSLMKSFMGMKKSEQNHEDENAVYTNPIIYDLLDAFSNVETSENDLKSFKAFLEKERADENSSLNLKEAISGIQYSYDLDLLVYTKNVDDTIIASDTEVLLQEMFMAYMGMDPSMIQSMNSSSSSSPLMSMYSLNTSSMILWQELLPGDNGKAVNDVLKKQYDLVYGDWPTAYNEVVLVLDENNELDDATLYALGLTPKENIDAIVDAAINQVPLEPSNESWTYEELCNMEFKVILNSDCYTYDQNTGLYADLRNTDTGLKYLFDNGIPLKVSGIIRQNPDVAAAMLSGSIGYTNKLTEYVVEHSKESEAIQLQLKNPDIDIFTNLPFKENTGNISDEDKEAYFRKYIEGLDTNEKAEAYVKIMSIPSDEFITSSVAQTMENMDRAAIEQTLIQALTEQMGMAEEEIASYLGSMSDEDLNTTFSDILAEQVKLQYAAQIAEQLAPLTTEQLAGALDMELASYTTKQCALYYDETLEFSSSTYEDNLTELGYVDLDTPSAINIYASSFENKEIIEDAITAYNKDVEEISQIKYTDYVGLMMSSVSTIINTITYVLIAFVAISLIVSSIMIGVITLISVQERTKEIGILRAMGASKKDVSSMFNAETLIIGFAAGLLGVVVTYLLCIPINLIIHNLTGINTLNAFLPIPAAVILVLISVLLTVFSGLIPSRSAAKKDPVVALRTE